MLPAQVREAIYLLCEVLKNADFGALEAARTELRAEQANESGLPAGLDLLRRALQARPELAELPYGRITRAQVTTYFQKRYTPDHTAIAVVGKFDSASVETALHDSLADFDRPGMRAGRNNSLYSHATNYPPRTMRQPGVSAFALVATPAPPLADADYAAFIVLKSVLGDGHASRLFRRLRDAQGIGYNVGAAWQTSLSDPMVAYLQWEIRPSKGNAAPTAAPENDRDRLTPDAALSLLNAQLNGLLTDPPTEAEIIRARSLAAGRETLRHERARDRAFLLAWYEAMGVGAEFYDLLEGRLAAVTREDVLRVARTYLTPRASVLVVPWP